MNVLASFFVKKKLLSVIFRSNSREVKEHFEHQCDRTTDFSALLRTLRKGKFRIKGVRSNALLPNVTGHLTTILCYNQLFLHGLIYSCAENRGSLQWPIFERSIRTIWHVFLIKAVLLSLMSFGRYLYTHPQIRSLITYTMQPKEIT